MSLLLGIFSTHGTLDPGSLQAMLSEFGDQGGRSLQRHDFPGALFASASPSDGNKVFSAPATTGALAGVVGTLNGQARPAQWALQNLGDNSNGRLADADGAFAGFRYDPFSHTLQLVNDKFGMRPVFIALSGDLLAFCSEYQPLLKLPGFRVALDHDAVAEYFALGCTLSDKTLVKGIRNLPAATVLTASQHGVEERRYWAPNIAIDHSASIEQLADEVASTVTTVTRGIVDSMPDLMCLLSAGADSRLILSCMTDAQRQATKFYTSNLSILPREHDKDVIGASQLAQALGLNHEIASLSYSELELGPSYFDRERHLRPIALLGGWHGGELLGGCCWGTAPISPDLDRAQVDARLAATFSPGFLIGLNHHPWDTYLAWRAGQVAENQTFQAQIGQMSRSFFSHIYKGSRGQWLQPFQIMNHGHSPFWDSRFLQAILKVPFDKVAGYGLYNVIFRDCLSSLRHIPSNSMLTLRPDTALARMPAGQEPKGVIKPNHVVALSHYAASKAVWQRGDYATALPPTLSDIDSTTSLKFVDFEAWRARHVDQSTSLD